MPPKSNKLPPVGAKDSEPVKTQGVRASKNANQLDSLLNVFAGKKTRGKSILRGGSAPEEDALKAKFNTLFPDIKVDDSNIDDVRKFYVDLELNINSMTNDLNSKLQKALQSISRVLSEEYEDTKLTILDKLEEGKSNQSVIAELYSSIYKSIEYGRYLYTYKARNDSKDKLKDINDNYRLFKIDEPKLTLYKYLTLKNNFGTLVYTDFIKSLIKDLYKEDDLGVFDTLFDKASHILSDTPSLYGQGFKEAFKSLMLVGFLAEAVKNDDISIDIGVEGIADVLPIKINDAKDTDFPVKKDIKSKYTLIEPEFINPDDKTIVLYTKVNKLTTPPPAIAIKVEKVSKEYDASTASSPVDVSPATPKGSKSVRTQKCSKEDCATINKFIHSFNVLVDWYEGKEADEKDIRGSGDANTYISDHRSKNIPDDYTSRVFFREAMLIINFLNNIKNTKKDIPADFQSIIEDTIKYYNKTIARKIQFTERFIKLLFDCIFNRKLSKPDKIKYIDEFIQAMKDIGDSDIKNNVEITEGFKDNILNSTTNDISEFIKGINYKDFIKPLIDDVEYLKTLVKSPSFIKRLDDLITDMVNQSKLVNTTAVQISDRYIPAENCPDDICFKINKLIYAYNITKGDKKFIKEYESIEDEFIEDNLKGKTEPEKLNIITTLLENYRNELDKSNKVYKNDFINSIDRTINAISSRLKKSSPVSPTPAPKCDIKLINAINNLIDGIKNNQDDIIIGSYVGRIINLNDTNIDSCIEETVNKNDDVALDEKDDMINYIKDLLSKATPAPASPTPAPASPTPTVLDLANDYMKADDDDKQDILRKINDLCSGTSLEECLKNNKVPQAIIDYINDYIILSEISDNDSEYEGLTSFVIYNKNALSENKSKKGKRLLDFAYEVYTNFKKYIKDIQVDADDCDSERIKKVLEWTLSHMCNIKDYIRTPVAIEGLEYKIAPIDFAQVDASRVSDLCDYLKGQDLSFGYVVVDEVWNKYYRSRDIIGRIYEGAKYVRRNSPAISFTEEAEPADYDSNMDTEVKYWALYRRLDKIKGKIYIRNSDGSKERGLEIQKLELIRDGNKYKIILTVLGKGMMDITNSSFDEDNGKEVDTPDDDSEAGGDIPMPDDINNQKVIDKYNALLGKFKKGDIIYIQDVSGKEGGLKFESLRMEKEKDKNKIILTVLKDNYTTDKVDITDSDIGIDTDKPKMSGIVKPSFDAFKKKFVKKPNTEISAKYIVDDNNEYRGIGGQYPGTKDIDELEKKINDIIAKNDGTIVCFIADFSRDDIEGKSVIVTNASTKKDADTLYIKGNVKNKKGQEVEFYQNAAYCRVARPDEGGGSDGSGSGGDGKPPSSPLPPVPSSPILTGNRSPIRLPPIPPVVPDTPRPKTRTGLSYQATQNIEGITLLLDRYGYQFLNIIVIDDAENNLTVSYIKAIDPNGIYVYVDLDALSANITVSQADLQKRLIAQANTTISSSLRNAAATSGKPTMIVSGSSFCAVKQCNDGTCDEKFYRACTAEATPVVENGIEVSVPISYPIVSISSIQQNGKNVEIANKKFYEETMERLFKETQDKLDSTVQACKYLDFAVCSFNNNRNLAFTALKNDRLAIAKAIEKQKDTPLNKKKHICNMTKRNDLYEKYLEITQKFSKAENFIMKLTKEITELNNSVVDAHTDAFSQDICPSA